MLTPGPAQRVVIHLNEDSANNGDYLHLEIVSFLFTVGVAGATVLRGHSGFGLIIVSTRTARLAVVASIFRYVSSSLNPLRPSMP